MVQPSKSSARIPSSPSRRRPFAKECHNKYCNMHPNRHEVRDLMFYIEARGLDMKSVSLGIIILEGRCEEMLPDVLGSASWIINFESELHTALRMMLRRKQRMAQWNNMTQHQRYPWYGHAKASDTRHHLNKYEEPIKHSVGSLPCLTRGTKRRKNMLTEFP